ncbi:ubiquitin thioesterase otubain-like [Uranotaenia lowii]|uniref:ubiquitin thioesterase otubain-like n=1 Tax=Uranotaenia lowii TaxID=190385 RepID=UPI00247ABA5B|nr:ubiquitin thioesterase otubain-like [Uranotaenia lowii]
MSTSDSTDTSSNASQNVPNTSSSSKPEENQDELIIQQQRQIEQEIAYSKPLVSESQTIESLSSEYLGDAVYISKVKDLSSKYQAIKRTRPDGNCFFRAFAYAYLEYLVLNKDEFSKFYEYAAKSCERLTEAGFPRFTIEDFYETFMEVINKVKPEGENTDAALAELHKLFNEQGYSDYVVVYLRLITSSHLQERADFYQNFIDGNYTIAEFCHQEVEPMYKESDHIHIIAICSALEAGVRVEYMDRGDGDQVIAHEFPDGCKPNVFLLYRPGHYDILYPNPTP